MILIILYVLLCASRYSLFGSLRWPPRYNTIASCGETHLRKTVETAWLTLLVLTRWSYSSGRFRGWKIPNRLIDIQSAHTLKSYKILIQNCETSTSSLYSSMSICIVVYFCPFGKVVIGVSLKVQYHRIFLMSVATIYSSLLLWAREHIWSAIR